MKPIKAWYFSDSTKSLGYGDGRGIAVGVAHEVEGELVLCEHGLHASIKILDALQYAPGAIVWRVELSGKVKRGHDKIVATKRTYLAGGVDISDLLQRFAREEALRVVHLWDCPDVVRQYLQTGDETIRSAAWAAASSAAWSAASSAARAAIWPATDSEAGLAARAAARSVVDSEAWSAASSAARAATRALTDAEADLAAFAASNKRLENTVLEAIKEVEE